jgi:glycosyltransferase involved in cell wall biosynthesis
MPTPQLTILMPCLNEAETLALCINKANTWIASADITAEVLIADNGSTDGSQDIATSLGARVVDVVPRGYGSALYHGCLAAEGRWIIMADSDDSYDFSHLDPFIEKLSDGYDLVMGNRFLGGIAPGAMPWKNKYIGNPILTLIGRILFRCPAKDFHCGLRGFTREAFHRMDLRTTGMEFASEMVIKATLFDMRIAEVPTTLSKDGRTRPPHLLPWRDGWRHLRFMLLFSPRWLFVIPGLILFAVSMLAYIIILSGPVHIGGVTFDVHTLFYAGTGLELGYLSVCFGAIIRIFGMRERLLPEHEALERIRSSPALEIGGGSGLLLITAGLILAVLALGNWGAAGFGPLERGGLLRQVSISSVLIMVGGITFMTSLILGFLALPTRRDKA